MGNSIPPQNTESSLPYAELWDEDNEEDEISPSMMGEGEPIVAEDPSLTPMTEKTFSMILI